MACRKAPAEGTVTDSTAEIVSGIVSTVTASENVESEREEPNSASTEIEDASAAPYESPVDFASLWEVNQDVYAWLDIPGTEISYPVVQHPEVDEYYLRRDLEGNYRW